MSKQVYKGAWQKQPAPGRIVTVLTAVFVAAILAACGGGGGSSSAPVDSTAQATTPPPALSAMASVGKLIFGDKNLSVSGQQACATCHVPTNGFMSGDNLATPLGGPNMDQRGLRNTPTLTYASFTPAFHFASDGTPIGGFFRDGRSPSLANQATLPFVTSFEMANSGSSEVHDRLITRPYLQQFINVFGASVLNDPDATLASMGQAVAAYETEDTAFHQFSSKFDYFQDGKVQLTALEQRGLALFNDPTKGNCTACHLSTRANNLPPMFTDFTYDSVAIPRNWTIPANQAGNVVPYAPQNGAALGSPNYAYYDMGLCGPLRTTFSGNIALCGVFKVPTLRNSALHHAYFHNGFFNNLNDVVTWYATRDTNPARWYLMQDGVTPDIPYNDLPVIYDATINVVEVPYNPGLAPSLTASEINAIVAFICTLTDGFDPTNPASYNYPAQCQAAAAAGI